MHVDDPLWSLTDDEREIVRRCVVAATQGPFFQWWRFPEDDPDDRPDPAKHHPARCRVISRERYDRWANDVWTEFHTIFGVTQPEAVRVLESWPNFETLPAEFQKEQLVERVINNTLNNLLGYPHKCFDVWSEYIPVPPREIERIFARWRTSRRNPKDSR